MTKEKEMGHVIRGYDYVEFYVGSAKMVAYWYAKAMGMRIEGYLGPETGFRDRISYSLVKNNLRIVVTSAISPETYEIQNFITKHGDGVKRWVMNVSDVKSMYESAVKNGAIPEKSYSRIEGTSGQGFIEEAAIKIFDDTEIIFSNRDHYKGIFKPGFGPPVQDIQISAEDTALEAIDHIVGNVRINEMDHWASYFNRTLNFETFVDFKPGDIGTQYSALLSKVVRSQNNTIKNPINEPYKGLRMSQIEEFIKEYRGSGIQHIAIRTHNILKTIPHLRKNGMEFLTVPDTYYETLRKRNLPINENISDLQENGILLDFEGDGYLLQLFTKPIGDRPTFFFEFIQRVGKSEGFGKGNFQALFEAIEEDQKKRGNLI